MMMKEQRLRVCIIRSPNLQQLRASEVEQALNDWQQLFMLSLDRVNHTLVSQVKAGTLITTNRKTYDGCIGITAEE